MNNSFSRRVAHSYETGSQVIAQLQTWQPQQAEMYLGIFLDTLEAIPPRIDVYLSLLEMTRPVVSMIASDLSKFYLAKPLPLCETEADLFNRVNACWLKMAEGYSYCAKNIPPEGQEQLRLIATCLQRCIYYVGQSILEHQRNYQECRQGLWLDLHNHYRLAEVLGIEQLALPDTFNQLARSSSCRSSYVAILLTDMAGCYSLSPREQAWVYCWAACWSSLVGLCRVRPEETLPPYIVDLTQDSALRSVSEYAQIETLRALETFRLVDKLKQIKRQLGSKVSPEKLLLGEGYSAEECAHLLPIVTKCWSQVRSSRKFRRLRATGNARLCSGFGAMYYHITGKRFVLSEIENEAEAILADQEGQSNADTALWADDWAVMNQSANGFGLARWFSERRVALGQLLALCPPDGKRFLLVKSRWLMLERDGRLVLGVKVLPGLPVGVSVRRLGSDPEEADDGRPYQAAFMLPVVVPSTERFPSLVLPNGWFVQAKELEIITDEGKARVRLLKKLEQGMDFERISFVQC